MCTLENNECLILGQPHNLRYIFASPYEKRGRKAVLFNLKVKLIDYEHIFQTVK